MNVLKRGSAMLMLAAALGGCATTNNPQDPLEGFNRAMFSFNDGLDQVLLKPAATVYREAVPTIVQSGVANFFGNIGDVWTAVNNLLQGKFEEGTSDIMRVSINTVMGLGGLLDIGSEAGLPKHREDFGETLAVWGVGPGPYVVLPFLGSSTLRDSLALPVDFYGDLLTFYYPVYQRNIAAGVRVIDARASILNASNLLEDAALDRYEFIRDAYLQRRASKIYDDYNRSRERDEKDGNKPNQSSAGPESTTRQSAGLPAGSVSEPATDSGVQLSGSAGKTESKGPNTGGAAATPISLLQNERMIIQRIPSSELPV